MDPYIQDLLNKYEQTGVELAAARAAELTACGIEHETQVLIVKNRIQGLATEHELGLQVMRSHINRRKATYMINELSGQLEKYKLLLWEALSN